MENVHKLQRVIPICKDLKRFGVYVSRHVCSIFVNDNCRILSGVAGMELLSKYCHYLNFTSNVWDEWRLDHNAKYATCLDIICVTQDAAYRLIFQNDVPKNGLLCEVCEMPEGVGFDLQKNEEIANAYRANAENCANCVDFFLL